VPPLEDLKEPFWEKHLNNLLDRDENFMLCTTIKAIVASNEKGNNNKRKLLTFETPLVLKPRPEKEMVLIRKWYDDTPKNLFPVPYGDRNPMRKVPGGRRIVFPIFENILVKGEKISQGSVMRSSNRYPGYPNNPTTWQGWQELEEKVTPSTMRDEIRLTRILIQYCDTNDEKVLEELKEWFADMNEIQRECMAKSLFDRARYDSGNPDLRVSLSKVYRVIREYDITVKTENEAEWLKRMGLLE